MYRILNQFFAVILVCFFFASNNAIAQGDEIVLPYETAYTIRDLPVDGEPDDISDSSDGRFFGLITNVSDVIDEFFLEFDISEMKQACSAKFNFTFDEEFFLPSELPYTLKLAVFAADCEQPSEEKFGYFGAGDFLEEILISNIADVFSVDVSDLFNDFINSGTQCIGIRLYEPISIQAPDDPAQLKFEEGNLTIVPRDVLELVDLMHPTGSVHAYPNLLWPPNNKKIKVKIEGYVIDELSMMRDGDGIGVSEAFLLVNGEKIILRDETTDLLNPDGSFSIKVRLKAKKNAIYPIEFFAADTVAEEDSGPNFGLVDSTFVRVPHDMSGKTKDKGNKKKKK